MNAFGGEDRIWLGPEGGQFSIFFKKGDPFDLEHWQTPALIDSEPWTVAARTPRQVVFKRESQLVNYSGTHFDFRIERTVRLVERDAAAKALGARSSGWPEARRLRVAERARQHGQERVDEVERPALDLDPRHVPADARHHGRRSPTARVRRPSSGPW